ncbi:FUSC family protein [Aeromicrobium marinum]|uniref:FUSC family protein n=1 Tax=Aeromicrobium marinum TaxID=219314 RepID=UPI000591147C|nr:FUSC family protein [Aeromicrobium marinum]
MILPPRAALRPAGVLLGVGVVALGAATATGGRGAALGVLVGLVAGLPPAVVRLPWSHRSVLMAATVALAVAGVAAHQQALPAAGLAGLAGLAQIPSSRASAGIGSMLPVVVVVTATVGPLPGDPGAPFVVGLVAGLLTVVAVLAALGLQGPAQPVGMQVARRHAVVVAVAVAATTYGVVAADVSHGYWAVLVLATVVRPSGDETTRQLRDRVSGTVLGLAAAVAVVLVVPGPAAVVLGLVSAVPMVGWAMVQDTRRAAIFAVPTVVLVASSGLLGPSVGLAADRLVTTAAAAVVAIAAALALHRGDRRRPAAPADAS